jgi:hypothetical protein
MPTNPADVRPLIRAHFPLIKIHPSLKNPADSGWREIQYSYEDIFYWIRDGGNVGWRLTETDLVLDVDPRNFPPGHDSLEEFVRDFALDLSAPHVLTGSGGHHYYFTKPYEVSILDSLAQYPGLEFKSVGRQVLVPGCLHPCGDNYTWAPDSLPLDQRPPFPDHVLAAVTRPDRSGPSQAGDLTPEQVQALLEQLPVDEYRDHDLWFQIMCACHQASAGDARQEFISWCISDPAYRDNRGEIGMRWDSLHHQRDSTITSRTLIRAVLDRGGEVPWRTPDVVFEPIGEADQPEGEDPIRLIQERALSYMNNHFAVVIGSITKVYSKQYQRSIGRFTYYKQSR